MNQLPTTTYRRLRRLPRWTRFAFLALLAGTVLPGGRELLAVVPRAGLERAISAQWKLVEERPADATAREDLGSLLGIAGDVAGAEAAYREALALDPASATAHFQLGGVLEKQGLRKKALREYEAAMELAPRYAWAYYEAGTIYEHWGLDGRAKKLYAKALGMDPTLADPQVNPHILENRLATSAMILAYRDYTPETSAPRTFHEPARIAGLILEKPPQGDQKAEQNPEIESPAQEEAGGYARATGGSPAHETAADPDEAEPGEANKTLTARDLDTGSKSGQVVNGAAVGGVPTTRTGKSSADTAAERARAREAARAAARPARTPSSGVSIPQNPMFAPGAPTGHSAGGGSAGGGGFKPAPESTGRIEVQLEDSAG